MKTIQLHSYLFPTEGLASSGSTGFISAKQLAPRQVGEIIEKKNSFVHLNVRVTAEKHHHIS